MDLKLPASSSAQWKVYKASEGETWFASLACARSKDDLRKVYSKQDL
jgi:hypothetical protein